MQYDYGRCEGARAIPDTFYPIEKLREFTHIGVVKTYAKDSNVILPGGKDYMLVYVLSGRISLNLMTEDGRERVIYFSGENGILGRLYKMENDNDAYAVAIEDSKVCLFFEEHLRIIFRQDEDMIFEVLRNCLSKVSYYMRQTIERDFYNPTIRILRLLHGLYLTNGISVGDSYEIRMDLSLQFISEITGAHYVTVSKVLKYLKEQKIIEKKKDKIIIHDLEKLKELTHEKHIYKYIY
ncbi:MULTISPECIES: Crp/Fnr family transcriptional regulator [Dehalobacter]|uniref:Crp/Fnr family transcriptional regulator n=1 Tax=Dehalobacter TaxID=56112 RepID=UPI00258D6553|nr:Crp/Fnr family transcriptional regulator [Dehalobacter sp.]MDJ0304529.1 Crp/Fnr family transcriptional regulator [Dehalobacter sp.]